MADVVASISPACHSIKTVGNSEEVANTKYYEVQQLTDGQYQELQHHLLILTDC
jgi:hypothetical protein